LWCSLIVLRPEIAIHAFATVPPPSFLDARLSSEDSQPMHKFVSHQASRSNVQTQYEHL
jgi:hypothetical protein